MKGIFFPLLLVPWFANAQVEQCTACHGASGEGNPQMNTPRIAGQPQAYLERQLQAYASGARQNAVMQPIAKGLSAAQRTQTAAHFAQIGNRAKPASAVQASRRARTLATRGDEKIRVQACQNCHGPGGTGLGPTNPFIAGLDAKYLESALKEWQSGTRKTDPSGQMSHIGGALTGADIRALAAYYGSQPPPRFAGRASATRQAKAGGGAPTAAGAGRAPTQGAGMEGGEPTQGGAQGPGGGGGASGAGATGSRTGETPSR